MENVADALKIAAGVLIFVLALSISITALGEVRQTSDMIMQYNDKEYSYTYVESNNNSTQRIVEVETVIPSIYKAYKENYKIIFKFKNTSEYIYQKYTDSVNKYPVCKIDLESEVLGTDSQKEEFLSSILYGTNNADLVEKFRKNLKIEIDLNTDGLYGKIKNKKFKEELGVYYQDELGQINNEDTPDVNKTKKRVITYTEVD